LASRVFGVAQADETSRLFQVILPIRFDIVWQQLQSHTTLSAYAPCDARLGALPLPYGGDLQCPPIHNSFGQQLLALAIHDASCPTHRGWRTLFGLVLAAPKTRATEPATKAKVANRIAMMVL
jgi:hypothetical protein